MHAQGTPVASGPSGTSPLVPLRWTGRAALVACFVVAAGSILTLVGWAIGSSRLISPVDGSTPTQPVAALALLILSLGCALQAGTPGRIRLTAGVVVGSVVVVFSAWGLVGYAAGIGIPLDSVLFRSRLDLTRTWPGRPALQTLIVLLALGMALIGLCVLRRWGARLAVVAEAIALVILTIVMVSFIAGAGEITVFHRTVAMSWPMACACLLLLAAIIGTRSDRPPLVWLTNGTLDAFTVSRVLPVIVAVPFVSRGVQLLTEWFGLSTTDASFVAELTALVLVGVALVGTAREKQRAENDLVALSTVYSAALEALDEGLVIRDDRGKLVLANPAAIEILRPLYGSSGIGDITPGDLPIHDEHGTPMRIGDWPTNITLRTGAPVHARLVRIGEESEERWLQVNAMPLARDGGAVTTMTDVTDRSRAERALVEAEERFRTAFENAPIGMAMVDIDGRFQRVNPAFCELLGRDSAELESLTSEQLTHPDDVAENLTLSSRLLNGDLAAYSMDKRYRHADGTWVWTALSVSLVRDADGRPEHFVAQILDLRDRKRLEEELSHMAMHDPLTELPNRRLVIDRLEQAVVRADRMDKRVGVVYIDLDGFKEINDSYGHDEGDRMLIEVAARLRSVLRRTDTAGRLGGDEFIVVSEGLSGDQVLDDLVRRIEESIQGEFPIGDQVVSVRASVGACLAKPNDDAETLLRVADGAMYAVKRARRAAAGSHLRVVPDPALDTGDEPDAENRR